MTLAETWVLDAGEHVQGLSWSADGRRIAITPAEGEILVAGEGGEEIRRLAGHGFGNGAAQFHPASRTLATWGTDGKVRIHPAGTDAPVEVSLGREWVEAIAWSPDGRRLAAACGRRITVLTAEGGVEREFAGHKSTVCDLAWNPRAPEEIAGVCDGGAHMWRIGEAEPFARFDWGGASLLVEWSPDGRWLVTGDQTASVHLYDFTRDYPLHIQGYETKVKALAFSSSGRQLATGGGRLVTLWPCTGKKGPEGAVPKQLPGHDGDCAALAWRPGSGLLASGGTDGQILLFEPDVSARPRAKFDARCAISAIAWQPGSSMLAAGTEDGRVLALAVEG